jgi:large subunit ribosomal protein L25
VADQHLLTAQSRTVTGKKVGQIRTKGKVPGTVYGPNSTPVNIQFDYRPLQLALMKAGGTSIIDLTVEGGKSYQVIAREVQRDVVRGDILHVDFFALDMTQKMRVDIPLILIGESSAVVAKKAILLHGSSNVTVEILPTELVQQIEVDVSVLVEIGDTLHMGDLKLAPGITLVNEPEEMVAKLVQPSAARAAEAEEAEEAAAAAMPEVIGRGKEDEAAEE